MQRLLATLLVLLPLPLAAQDPATGRPLAERWCMACHIVEREPKAATGNRAPDFEAIAARPGTTASSLDRYLSSGHTNMPDFRLSAGERGALIAYILSLK